MDIDDFLSAFLGGLAASSFSTSGALDEYLALDPDRSGDEANIVDFRISRHLLDALGYTTSEINYNTVKQHRRADFVVRIPEYPIRACFVIEDKSTVTTDLAAHRPQLQGYMHQNRAPRGLLINGHAILAFDHQESIQTPSIEISLAEAVRAWRGASLFAQGKTGRAALEELDVMPQLTALWRRHRRESFSGIQTLINDLTLQKDGSTHEINGGTWDSAHARISIVPVTQNPEALTIALKEIIAELEDDAGAQLAAHEKEFAVFSQAAEQIPGESGTLKQQEETLVSDVLTLCPDADESFRERLETMTRQVVNGIVSPELAGKIQADLYALHGVKKGETGDQISKLTQRLSSLAIKKRIFLEKLKLQYAENINVHGLYARWKDTSARVVFQSDDEKRLRREFLAQTAYLIVIRTLLVRIMEDKGLTKRVFTNGGVALWFGQVEPHYLEYATGRGTDYLLDLAYSSAQHLYAHFYDHHTVLDWYRPDRNAVIRLLHALAGFDFKNIDRDIIGSIYNEYVEAEHKHESGLYYTRKSIVEYMLDRVDYNGAQIIDCRLVDIASGSGGFLVSAAKRLIEAHRAYWKGQGQPDIPPDRVQAVLDNVRNSLFGIDLNPFACALAETNLLIQVIDLVAIALKAGEPASIDKFHIYNSDSLSFAVETRRQLYGALTFPESELPVDDQLKLAIGSFSDHFDFVVGNPPYVKANESEFLGAYRDRIKTEHPLEAVKSVMVQKWDLYIPFVAQSFELLKEGGRMALITSSAIETVPYGRALREHLVQHGTVREVHFFPGLRLFPDAAVENTIFVVEKRAPTDHDLTDRFYHDTVPGD